MTNQPNNLPEDDYLEVDLGGGLNQTEEDSGESYRHAHSGKHPMSKTRKKRTKGQKVRRVLLIILCVLLAILLAVGAAWFVLYKKGQKKLLNYKVDVSAPKELELMESIEDNGNTVQYNGATYRYNTDSVNILLIGLDKQDYDKEIGYGKNGQGDALLLVNMDTVTGEINVLPISRDTKAEVQVISTSGSYLRTDITQICLAYAYGKDRDDGCQLIRASVRSLLYNIPIDHYISIDMEGLEKLTDAMGGVRLTPIESISNKYGSVTKGKEVTLKGDLVNLYVRYRDEEDVNVNNRRMDRQKQFVQAFVSQTAALLKNDPGRLPKFYNTAKPYTASNITLDEITYLVTRYLSAGRKALVYQSIKGEMSTEDAPGVTGGKRAVFTPDETSLWECVLATCYKKQ